MSFIFSTTVLIRHLWQLKTVVFLYMRLLRVVILLVSQYLYHSILSYLTWYRYPSQLQTIQDEILIKLLKINTQNCQNQLLNYIRMPLNIVLLFFYRKNQIKPHACLAYCFFRACTFSIMTFSRTTLSIEDLIIRKKLISKRFSCLTFDFGR